MQSQIYFHSHLYFETIDRIEQAARAQASGSFRDLRSDLIEILGDLGIWPVKAYSGDEEEGQTVILITDENN